MPPARTTTARATTAPRPRPRRAQQASARPAQARLRRERRKPRPAPWARVRWDRIGRTALLIVLVVVAGLYIQHTVEYFVTRSNADAQRAIAHRLVRQNVVLRAQRRALQQPDTIQRYARKLGMVKPGERPYVILGMPSSAASLAQHHERR